MQRTDWAGVYPAITTPFTRTLELDHAALAAHVNWMLESGCAGIVTPGSLGEAPTLSFAEKIELFRTCRSAMGKDGRLVAAVSGSSTAECVALAEAARDAGCNGLMVLPPYVYRGDWREMEAHFSAVISATPLSCMLYNNPIAYGTDVSAEQIEVLARHENLHAVKESSGDVRRVTAVRERLGDRLALFAGLDDMILECIPMGAEGWIAGLVNALPVESVRLVEWGRAGRWAEARALYDWFLPLLRFDTVPKFVQLIKLVQAEVGRGSEDVRPPRLPLAGAEREDALAIIRDRLASKPAMASDVSSGAQSFVASQR
jgi:4-hydroxy-tetrahydrodipicolinate synthase